ncbi:TrbI/VirB10 family protein [Mycoavidus sp. B2-EB]|uniref:TrbI/VirB10 family protein n=1 Tax=Mycoavidus sp. B2-EB TaxID=2651972 RepID=UPI001629F003|nr:TrbI/VirB10 family protein [Mycoavidus sp. B2-EB]BBO59924.1 conjugal transfer protein TrbI [Mycoavidus sp. B2-EB]
MAPPFLSNSSIPRQSQRVKRNLVQVLLTVLMLSMLVIVMTRRFTGTAQIPAQRETLQHHAEYRMQSAGNANDIRSALRQQAERAYHAKQQDKIKPEGPPSVAPPLPPAYNIPAPNTPFAPLSNEQKLTLERARAALNEDTDMAVYEAEERRVLGNHPEHPNPLAPLPPIASAPLAAPHTHPALQQLLNQHASAAPAVSRDEHWLRHQNTYTSSQPLMPTSAASPYLLMMGEPIPVVTLQSVNSDLPGTVRAMVTRDIYDSVRGHFKVIPRGTILVGVSNADVLVGQSRLLIAFNRMNFPSGAYLDISGVPATDRSGSSGLPAHANHHFLRQFSQAFLVAGIAAWAGRQPSAPPNVTINVSGSALPSTFSQTAAQTLSDIARRMLDHHQNIKPTLTLSPGEKITIMVARDMVLPPAVVANYEGVL